jgi:integrase
MKNGFAKNLAIRDWHECDRKVWEAALRPGSILDNVGGLSHLRASSVAHLARSYGRWLWYLLSHDLFEAGRSGFALLSPDLFRGYVTMLRSNFAPITALISAQELAQLANLFRPERDWRFVQASVRQLRREAKPIGNARAPRSSSRELYDLGLKLMTDAEAVPTPIRRAKKFRNGLVISFLAARPLRVGNLTMIGVNRHLQLQGKIYWVHFEPEETKNHRSIDFPWPIPLHDALIRYLKLYRPILLKACPKYHNPSDRLWAISSSGGLHKIITKNTARWSGERVNPQLFRRAAATSTAYADPEHVRIVTPILGHASFRTAELYYNKATSIEAVRRYQKHIAKLQQPYSGK